MTEHNPDWFWGQCLIEIVRNNILLLPQREKVDDRIRKHTIMHLSYIFTFYRMTNREYFIQRWKSEIPVFVKVLQAVNEEKWDYKPDEKSKTAKQMVQLFVGEIGMFTFVATGGKIDMANEMPKPAEGTLADMVSMFEKGAAEYTVALEAMDEEMWENSKTGFYKGGQPIWEETVKEVLWMFSYDMVHHRGQLSTYLRAMGGKVPSIYGPSADDLGPMAGM